MNTKTPPTKLDVVDRLAAAYQQARLHRRRMHRCVADAIAAGNVAAVRAALARLQIAIAWEHRTERRYLRAVFIEHAWWLHGPHGGPLTPPALPDPVRANAPAARPVVRGAAA